MILHTIIAAAVLLAIGFFGMAVKIIFHKSHKFPETSAGHNREMRKRGIRCPKEEEARLHGTTCATCYANARPKPVTD